MIINRIAFSSIATANTVAAFIYEEKRDKRIRSFSEPALGIFKVFGQTGPPRDRHFSNMSLNYMI